MSFASSRLFTSGHEIHSPEDEKPSQVVKEVSHHRHEEGAREIDSARKEQSLVRGPQGERPKTCPDVMQDTEHGRCGGEFEGLGAQPSKYHLFSHPRHERAGQHRRDSLSPEDCSKFAMAAAIALTKDLRKRQVNSHVTRQYGKEQHGAKQRVRQRDFERRHVGKLRT